MDKVYYWDADDVNSSHGHAAMDISFGEGPGRAEYVSWFPIGNWNLLTPGPTGVRSNYTDDRDDQHREAVAVVELRCLDSDRMRREWYSLKKTVRYTALTQNCSTIVQRLLVAGGASFSPLVWQTVDDVIIWTPLRLYTLALLIRMESDTIIRKRRACWGGP